MTFNQPDLQMGNTIRTLGFDMDGFDFQYDLDRKTEGLTVAKTGNSIMISCSERVFLFRALGLLKENIDKPSFRIEENASFAMNGIMLDCSFNGVLNLSCVKKIIRQLALMGINTLLLYTEDTYEMEGHPYFGYMRGRYSLAEWKEIDDYAYGFGIEVVPCIQTLGHLGQVLKWDGVYGDISDTGDVLLVGEEKTYRFIEEMLSACKKAFRSNRIHIGMDETHSLGRGKYYELHGDCDRRDIFQAHLDRVDELCRKYGYRPMIWGDMYLRYAGCVGYTDGTVPVDDLVLDHKIPDSVDCVYWDYYSKTPERYGEFIRAHQKMAKSIVFAGGAWRWSNFTPSMEHSILSSVYGLSECKKNGIRDVFVTLWSSPSNESSVFAAWPVVQLYAECNFHDYEDVDFPKRFKTCTGGNWDDFCALEKLNRPCGLVGKRAEDNPLKYMLYQDPLLGLYDFYIKPGFNDYYAECTKELRQCAERAGEYRYIFEVAHALSRVLADKAELGVKIKSAYDAGNKAELKMIAEETLERLIENTEAVHQCFEKQWLKEYKAFSYEVMDIRFGGLVNRLKTAQKRIRSYLDGTVEQIEELTVEKLPYNGQKQDIVMGYHWHQIVTPSSM